MTTAKKLQETPNPSKVQKDVLRSYFGLDLRRNFRKEQWIGYRAIYNTEQEQLKKRGSFYKTKKGLRELENLRNTKLENLRERMKVSKAKRVIEKALIRRSGDVKVIHVPFNFRINPDEENKANNMKSFMKLFRGKKIRMNIFVGNQSIFNREFDVPSRSYTKWWDSVYRNFYTEEDSGGGETIFRDYHFGNPEIKNDKILPTDFKIIVSTGSKVSPEKLNQVFADGISHCMFQPILDWAETQMAESKSKKYPTLVNKLKKYIKQYSGGIPEEDLQAVANDLQINISVNLPLCKQTLVEANSMKKALRRFRFINTRVNHVELNEVACTDNVVECTREEMDELVDKFQAEIEEGKMYYFRDKNMRFTSIYTLDKTYRVVSEYSKAKQEFERQFGLDRFSIDHDRDWMLSHFVRDGTHFNGTVDYCDGNQGLKHIDMTKAYTKFGCSKWYCGFLGKITDFRNCEGVDTDKQLKIIGMYRIKNLVLPDNKHLKKLNIYVNDAIYTSPELIALRSWGATFDLVEGCWGIEKRFHFDEAMTDGYELEDVNGRKKKIRYFSKWTGECFSLNTTSSYYMKGSKEYFQNLNWALEQEGIQAEINCYTDGEGRISYPKKATHKSHITAFILAYQRLNVLEQLFKMDYSKVRQVCVDGIYYWDHPFEHKSFFREKDEIKVDKTYGTSSYCSGIVFDTDDEYEVIEKGLMTKAPYREHFETECWIGAGGNGKTHRQLTDDGLVGKLFVAPSWELATSKKNEYGCDATVLSRALDEDADVMNAKTFCKRYSTLIVDEVSMLTEEQKEKLFAIYHDFKIIFCGDIGYQLPPVSGEVMNMNRIDKVEELKVNYRFKCEKHSAIIDQVRAMIENKAGKNKINEFICKNYQNISADEMDYSVNDIILCSRTSCGVDKHPKCCNCNGKNYSQYWNDKFGEGKWRCLERGKLKSGEDVFNGTVVYDKPVGVKHEVRHGFTIHSVQGKTYKNKIFIDSRNLFSPEMGYTAISRAEYWDQIYIVNV